MKRLIVCSTQFQLLSMLAYLCEYAQAEDQADVVLLPPFSKDERWIQFFSVQPTISYLYGMTRYRPEEIEMVPRRILLTRKLRGKTTVTWKRIWQQFRIGKDLLKARKYWVKENCELLKGSSKKAAYLVRHYDEILYGSMDGMTSFIETIQKTYSPQTPRLILDEGVGTYIGTCWQKTLLPQALALFSSPLYEGNERVKPLPKLDSKKLSTVLANVPNYFTGVKAPLPKHIFFDQWLHMPWQGNPLIQEEWKNSAFIATKLNVLTKIDQILPSDLAIKTHPASLPSVSSFYQEAELMVLPSSNDGPFELNLLYSEKAPKILITIYSSAVLSPFVNFEATADMQVIILWKMFRQWCNMPAADEEKMLAFFERVQATYPDQIFMPASEAELIDILQTQVA